MEIVRQRLNQHGDLFVSRWKKRSKHKRAELLLRASTNLPEDSDTEFNLTQSNGGRYDWRKARNVKYRAAALLPYLNTSTLKDNPSMLFALLHFRTKYNFEEWAPFDLYQFRDPWKVGLLDVKFSPLCVLLHGPRYGELVPFHEAAAHRGDILGFPRAQLLLEAQSNLMQFLNNVTGAILGRCQSRQPLIGQVDGMSQEGFHATGDVAQWSSYTHQPFPPPPFEIDSIIETAQTRLRAVTDHLALLQTNHTYLHRYIRLCSQGEIHKDGRWADALTLVDASIVTDVLSLYWWTCVKDEAEYVRDVRHRFCDQICRGSPLPPKYDRALASLELVLVNMMNVRGKLYSGDIQQRPGFKHFFTFKTVSGGVQIGRKNLDPFKNQFQEDPLFCCRN